MGGRRFEGHSSLRCQSSSLCLTEIVELALTRECSSKKLDSCMKILLTKYFVSKFLTLVSHSMAGRVASPALCTCRTAKCHSMEESWGKVKAPVEITACELANRKRSPEPVFEGVPIEVVPIKGSPQEDPPQT